jgi:hypothetical protein
LGTFCVGRKESSELGIFPSLHKLATQRGDALKICLAPSFFEIFDNISQVSWWINLYPNPSTQFDFVENFLEEMDLL